ncbi:MAG: hypothetical protein ACHQIG_14100, partial [Acidimicrobiia bacterium]
MSISIRQLPERVADTSRRFRDELAGILGDDLVGMWLYGGTTFPDRPRRAGDLDFCAAIASATPEERDPSVWTGDAGSRPQRIVS